MCLLCVLCSVLSTLCTSLARTGHEQESATGTGVSSGARHLLTTASIYLIRHWPTIGLGWFILQCDVGAAGDSGLRQDANWALLPVCACLPEADSALASTVQWCPPTSKQPYKISNDRWAIPTTRCPALPCAWGCAQRPTSHLLPMLVCKRFAGTHTYRRTRDHLPDKGKYAPRHIHIHYMQHFRYLGDLLLCW
jgi:hypothetical protein